MTRLLPLFLPLLASCALVGDPRGGTPARLAPAADGIEYRAKVQLERHGTEVGSLVYVRPTVVLVNTTDRPREILVAGCELHFEIHRRAAVDEVAVWKMEGSGRPCGRGRTMTLPPGGVHEIEDVYSIGNLLSRLGGPGEYHFAMRLVTEAGETVLPIVPADLTFQAEQLEYRAAVRLEWEGTATAGPARVRSTVEVTNTSDEPRELLLAGCRVDLAIHRSALGDQAPAWTTGESGASCGRSRDRTMILAPGGTHTIELDHDATFLVRQLGEPGEYYLAMRVITPGGQVVLPPIPVDLSLGADQITLRAESGLEGTLPAQLWVETTVTNSGTERLRVEFGGCAPPIRAYLTAEPIGTPVWDTAQRNPGSVAGIGMVCFGLPEAVELGPGESHQPSALRRVVRVSDILGDSLPGGRYFFFTQARLNGSIQWVPAGEVTLVRD